jgi:hypothetical protein
METREGRMLRDLVLMGLILGGWLLLQLVILPRLGVET